MNNQYNPKSYFFTESDKLAGTDDSNEYFAEDAFGPVQGHEASRYRLTSWVRATDATERVKIFSITRGRILIVPCVNGKVNLVQRVERSIDPSFPLRYIIYRGIETSDFILGDNMAAASEDSCTLLRKIWIAYCQYRDNENIVEFPAADIGYRAVTENGDKLLDEYFNYADTHDNNSTYQLPMVREGEWIGCFRGKVGIDMVLDEGDAVSDITADLFPISMKYATAECGMLDENDVNEGNISAEL